MEDVEKGRGRQHFPSVRGEAVNALAPRGLPASATKSTPDEFLDWVIDTLRELDPSVQGSFLQKLLTNLTGISVSEGESIAHWQGILSRRDQLVEDVGRRVLAQRIARNFQDYAKALAPKIDLGLDYGLASYPMDGADGAKLFDAADRSLYANKQIAYRQKEEPQTRAGSPSPELGTPQESSAPSESPQPFQYLQASQPASIPTRLADEATRASGSSARERESRRCERMSLQAAPSVAAVHVGTMSKLARVLDLSLEGVGLLLDEATELISSSISDSALSARRVHALPC